MKHLFKKYILLMILTLSLSAGAVQAAQVVDVSFDPDPDSWERNSIQYVDVVLTASDEAVDVAGLELSFTYDASKFKGIPTMAQDNFSGNLFVNNVDLSTPGTVLYQKGKSVPYSQSIGASGSWVAFRLRFEVTEEGAEEGATSFTFNTAVDDVTNRAGNSVGGTFDAGAYTIIADTTPPIIVASPTSVTMNASTYQTVALAVSGADYSDDLQGIYYTVDGTDPNGSGTVITYSGPITLPENQFTTLRYYADDIDNNDSQTWDQTYTVDTDYPGYSAITATPSHGLVGTVVTVSFTVDELIQSNILVQVDGNTAIQQSAAYPDYVYTYVLTGSENEGSRAISVRVTDLAGNTYTDNSSLSIDIDFTGPTYDPVTIYPEPVQIAQPVIVTFTVSERLNSASSVDIMGRSSSQTTEINNGNGTYTYSYTSTNLDGTENTALIVVHGTDLAGNSSNSNDNWGEITVSGQDIYANPGSSTASVTFDFIED
jgi:chitobiase/beta-hexosaminidase-like protein